MTRSTLYQETIMLKQKNIPLVLVLIYCSVIFIVSSIPGAEISGLPAPDYVMHALEYTGLGLLLCWWRTAAGEPVSRAIIQAVVMGSLYGISDEFHQYFVPGRFSSVSDWAADTVGATAGALLFAWFLSWLRNRKIQHMEPGFTHDKN